VTQLPKDTHAHTHTHTYTHTHPPSLSHTHTHINTHTHAHTHRITDLHITKAQLIPTLSITTSTRSHPTRMSELSQPYAPVVPRILTSHVTCHVTCTNESCHPYKSHSSSPHSHTLHRGKHTQSCHTHERVMSHA